ncbi:hypothetical protein [Shimia sp. MIT1388]|uniref:hypothetical protein n=1 Tax=Shimia sp. MIT1388 TaxID=3096992 RepID=UPI00399B92E4
MTLGIAIGATGFFVFTWATEAADALDHGIGLTHCHAEQDALRQESDVLKAMVEPHWLNLNASTAQSQLKDLGIFDFAKGTEGLAAGPVFLRTDGGIVTEIQTHCARLSSKDCAPKGDS